MNSRINLAFYGFGTMVLLGDALVNLRFTGNLLDDIIGISLAVLLAALTAFFFKFIYKYNVGKAVFLPLLCLSGLFTVYSFSSYAAVVMLKTENVILPFLALTAISVNLAQIGKKAIYKLSFKSGAVVGALIIVIALFSVQFMSAK